MQVVLGGPMEELGEHTVRSRWVNCGLQSGFMFAGKQFAEGRDNPMEPFGVVAVFYDNRLTELSFSLDATSIEDVRPMLELHYGQATSVKRNAAGVVDSANWADEDPQLSAEAVTTPAMVAAKGILHIDRGASRECMRIRIQSTRPPRIAPWSRLGSAVENFALRHPWILWII
jgi:hypothetical protein